MSTTGRLRAATVVLLLLVATAACGGGGSKKPKADDASTVPTTTVSASAGAKKKAGPTKVCSLIPAALLGTVLPNPVEKLGYGSENYAVCGTSGTVSFEFGYRIIPGGEGLPAAGQYTKPISGFGDAAMLDQDKYSATIWAKRGDEVFQVRNETIANTSGVISLDTTKAVMTALLKAATPKVIKETKAIVLPKTCPAADSPEVTAMAGTVKSARGDASQGSSECQYLGSGGTRVYLDGFQQKGADTDFVVSHAGEEGTTDADVPGSTDAFISAIEPGEVELYWSTDADTAWAIDATPLTDYTDYKTHSGPATKAGAQTLAVSFMALNPDLAH